MILIEVSQRLRHSRITGILELQNLNVKVRQAKNLRIWHTAK